MMPDPRHAVAARDAILQAIPPHEGMAARAIIVLVAFTTPDSVSGCIEQIVLTQGGTALFEETTREADALRTLWEHEWMAGS